MTKSTSKWLMAIVVLLTICLGEAARPVAAAESFTSSVRSPRMGSVELTLRDESGAPWVNAAVMYTQTTHDFLFGVGMTSPQGRIPPRIFEELKTIGVNYALPFVSWAETEPHEGSFDWVNTDYMYRPQEMQGLGYTLNGHCMIFFLDESWNLPSYVRSMDFEELKQAISEHVFTLVSHYRGLMAYWTINEPTWSYSDFFKLSKAQWIDVVSIASKAVRKADSNAKIMINVVPVSDPGIGYSPQAILDALVNSGVDFDAIGLELYPFFAEVLDANGYPSVEWASTMLDSFAGYAKPIILSEVGISDKPSQEAQAGWLRSFYAMAFEKPFVTGITWYFIDDDPFLPGAGLFPNTDSPPRQIYGALADVIQERTTAGTARTDSEGIVRIEGFAGDYLIRVNDGLRRTSSTVHITEGQDESYTLSLGVPPEYNYQQLQITLNAGWNLVSLPVIPTNPDIKTLLTPLMLSNELTVVWAYNSKLRTWQSFIPGKPSTLTTMSDGSGYWIFMRSEDTLNLDGYIIQPAQTPPSYSLTTGWSLIGFKPQPTVANETVGAYLTSIAGKYDSNNVWILDNSSGNWIRATDSTWLAPGQAMWILMATSATLRP